MVEVFVVDGFDKGLPEPVQVGAGQTVGEFKARQASRLGINTDDCQLVTDSKKLFNNNDILAKQVRDGETVHVMPRAKGGA